MPCDPKADLVALLPGGEWLNVRILNLAPGMMASHNWAVLAKARWLRQGGRDAFIKFIVPAGATAGDETEMVTGEARLRQLEGRLQAIRHLGAAVPVVPLLEVRLTDRGLLIAMEEVRPLQDVIERGEAYELSERMLRDLDPDKHEAGDWFHYDICPMNVGVTAQGGCVLIDVESLYLATGAGFNVSVPAWKRFRVPRSLRDEIDDRQAAGAVPLEDALKKVRFEVALAAAECILGPMPTDVGCLDDARLDKWLHAADRSDPAVAFWGRELRQALARGAFDPLGELADRLRVALSTGPAIAHAPRIPTSTQVVSEQAPPVTRGAAAPTGFEIEWVLLKPAAYALRAGKLDAAGVRAYRAAVEQLAAKYPMNRELWTSCSLFLSHIRRIASQRWRPSRRQSRTCLMTRSFCGCNGSFDSGRGCAADDFRNESDSRDRACSSLGEGLPRNRGHGGIPAARSGSERNDIVSRKEGLYLPLGRDS